MVDNSRLRIVPPFKCVFKDDASLYYRNGLKFKPIAFLPLVTILEKAPSGIREGAFIRGRDAAAQPAVPASLSDPAASLSS
jgi:hypothetical protein